MRCVQRRRNNEGSRVDNRGRNCSHLGLDAGSGAGITRCSTRGRRATNRPPMAGIATQALLTARMPLRGLTSIHGSGEGELSPKERIRYRRSTRLPQCAHATYHALRVTWGLPCVHGRCTYPFKMALEPCSLFSLLLLLGTVYRPPPPSRRLFCG